MGSRRKHRWLAKPPCASLLTYDSYVDWLHAHQRPLELVGELSPQHHVIVTLFQTTTVSRIVSVQNVKIPVHVSDIK